MSHRFPSIPKTGVEDPKLRPVIDAIRSSVEVGTSGPQESRWVTWADLQAAGVVVKEGKGFSSGSGGAGVRGGGGGGSPLFLDGGFSVLKLLRELQGQIKEEHLYKTLNERIDKIDGSNVVSGSVEQRINDAGEELARQINTVSTATAQNRATVQVVSESVGGLRAQYTVKIDNNGFMAGYGLSSEPKDGTPFSNFIVLADRFSIVNPSATLSDISSLTLSGTTATLVWSGTLPTLTTSDYITVRNAQDGKWNGTWKVASVDNATKTVTFTVSTSPTTPATAVYGKTLKVGAASIPFIVDGGKVYIENAMIHNLTSDNIATGSITVGSLAEKPIIYVGEFATAPAVTGYEINSVYKNTTDNNTYILVLVGTTKTWTLYLPKGADGSSAQLLSVSADSQVFRVAKSGTASPSSIGIYATAQNLSGSPTFTVSSGTATLTGTGNSRTLTYANLTTDTATITVTWGSLTDYVTIAKVREGTDSVVAFLTNEAHVLQSDTSGVVSSYAGATTDMKVFVGITDDTANWSFTRANSTGVTSTISSNTVAVTAMSVDSGYVDITAAKTGYSSVTKRFSISKAKAGSTGATGSTGTRGTVNIAATTTGSSWSDTTAATALSNAGYGSPQNRDIVTLYNTSTSYSETKYYSSGSWLSLTAYINGNLLVSGTVTANKLDVGSTSQGLKVNTTGTPNGVYVYQNSSTVYGLYVDNAYSGSGGGAASIKSNYGYTLECNLRQDSSSDYAAIAAVATSAGGGNARVAIPISKGGWAFYSNSGGYGSFTGAHDSLIDKNETILPGDIVIDSTLVAVSINDSLTVCTKSSAPAQKGALGAYVLHHPIDPSAPPAAMKNGGVDAADYASDYNCGIINGLGEGAINVCGENGDIEIGDLIVTSSIPGKGMKQSDDIVRSITVAKARQSVTFSSPTEVKMIGCIYLCG